MSRTALQIERETWPYAAPFRITGHVRREIEVVVATVSRDGVRGRGEALGVRYRGETAESMAAELAAVTRLVEGGVGREELRDVMPAGGARNALDCALWDLEAQLTGIPVWQLARVPSLRPVPTTVTLGADPPHEVAVNAARQIRANALKIKLVGDGVDGARVRAVRDARPDVTLTVDANQGFTPAGLEQLMPLLLDNGVVLIEQPFPVGQDHLLDAFYSPLPIAADESIQGLDDVAGMVGRYQIVNIKLDKCGGLTEALMMARGARSLGLGVMVGCMGGTSLGMAPGLVVGQLCDLADLDGPLLLRRDRQPPAQYAEGRITCPASLWGFPMCASAPERAE